jgi:hypothetical protein
MTTNIALADPEVGKPSTKSMEMISKQLMTQAVVVTT